jgi:hypothetical protein
MWDFGTFVGCRCLCSWQHGNHSKFLTSISLLFHLPTEDSFMLSRASVFGLMFSPLQQCCRLSRRRRATILIFFSGSIFWKRSKLTRSSSPVELENQGLQSRIGRLDLAFERFSTLYSAGIM